MFKFIARLFRRLKLGRGSHSEWMAQRRADCIVYFSEQQHFKNIRLAEIARERNALKDELAKVIQAKKARASIYAALRALSIEELKVEGRR